MNEMKIQGAVPPPDQNFAYPHRWAAMFTLLAANFMVFLDVNIVLVAIPSIQSSLQANMMQMEWVVAVYIACYALALLPLGKLGDLYGRKKLFASGVAGFIVSSFLCGASTTVEMLIFSRILQAVSAAMISPQVMAVATSMFSPKERSASFALFGLVAGLAAIVGPVVSGALIKVNPFDFGWRSIFYINIPIGLAVLFVALYRVPNTASYAGERKKNDWLGVLLVGIALLSLIFPLIEGRAYGWPLWCFLLMAAFIPIISVFIGRSIKLAKENKPTLLPIYLMANRNYMFGAIAVMGFFSALEGFLLIFVIFLQQGHEFTPMQTGMATVPFSIGVLVATVIAARFQNLKVKIFSGATLCFVSTIVLWFVVNNVEDLGAKGLMLPLLIGGLGSGVTIASLFQTVMRTVPLKDTGAGSGALQAMQQVGGALGIALVSQIFFSGFLNDAQSVEIFNASFKDVLVYCMAAYVFVVFAVFGVDFKLPSKNEPQRPPVNMPLEEGS
ncbi:MFS transporter [Endozoicomonas sp. SM1973]|uniref:MFS transporter n=1 Tax=Spartinivicinus marinus TaxID=2994442 RepID=A0A853ICB1_9GAMM|nr:MFS transporter [Spartinivicinus marinus]MCX4030105.1 MFS transporter [Spartinivicinus marinus]NYZ69492.1 MFS transporter [Spartinivicinus marinus]